MNFNPSDHKIFKQFALAISEGLADRRLACGFEKVQKTSLSQIWE
jgi:hypothetical protein